MQLSFERTFSLALVSSLLVSVTMGCTGEIGSTSENVSSTTPGVSAGIGGRGGGSSTPAATAGAGGSAMPTTPTTPTTPTAPTTPTTPPATPMTPTTMPTTPATPTTMAAAAGTIVPLYTPPGDPSWTAIVAAKMAHPRVRVVAVVNPANGPGAAKSTAYANGITRLATAGIEVIGYVSTDYTRRAEATVKADIATWKSWYPDLRGIFFDEQSNKAGDEDLYKRYSQYAKQMGLAFTVGNPGVDTRESYVGTVDAILIYESRGLSSVEALSGWHTKYAASNFGVIPYGTAMNADYVRMARAHVGFIYLNNDELPNPWDSLPPYFGDLLAALE